MTDDAKEPIALDVHAHLIPIVPERLANLPGAEWHADKEQLVLDGHAIGIKNLFRPEALIAWMDENGVERAWISAPPPAYRQTLDDKSAVDWVRYLNDGLEGISKRFPNRFSPLFHLPLEKPALASEIARERIAGGARCFSAPAGGQTELCFSDAALDPLWTALDAAHTFLFLHPGSCCDGRLSAFYLENLLGNPYETAVAVAHLVFGAVSTRFPNIRFCLAHGGGATAAVAGRFQQGFDTKRPGIDTVLATPRELLKGFFVDCITHDPNALELAANVFGSSHIVFGSDWPFPMGVLKPHAQLAPVKSDLRRKILHDNAATALVGRFK